jgi:hypothetical protein
MCSCLEFSHRGINRKNDAIAVAVHCLRWPTIKTKSKIIFQAESAVGNHEGSVVSHCLVCVLSLSGTPIVDPRLDHARY